MEELTIAHAIVDASYNVGIAIVIAAVIGGLLN